MIRVTRPVAFKLTSTVCGETLQCSIRCMACLSGTDMHLLMKNYNLTKLEAGTGQPSHGASNANLKAKLEIWPTRRLKLTWDISLTRISSANVESLSLRSSHSSLFQTASQPLLGLKDFMVIASPPTLPTSYWLRLLACQCAINSILSVII